MSTAVNHFVTLQQDIETKFGKDVFKFTTSFVGDHVIDSQKESLSALLRYLKEYAGFHFIMDICGVDYPNREKRFDVVYHLFSSAGSRRVRVKTQIKEDESVPSAISIWKGADWFEREAYDMFGIQFKGHPNLRKILTHHQFVGYPLRKDYEADQQQH